MSKIFISYSRSDKSIVDEFIKKLEAAGHPVWVDREGIRGGEQWRQEIVEAIEQNDVFLLVLTNNSIKSDHVRTEVDLAKESHKRIIPVDIQRVVIPTSMKYQLAGLQRINMYRDYEDGFQELLVSLGGTPEAELGKTQVSDKILDPGRKKFHTQGIYILGIVILVFFIATLAYLSSKNSNQPVMSGSPGETSQSPPGVALLTETLAPLTPTPTGKLASLDQLTTIDELEPLLLQANIRLSQPEDEARTRSYFTGPDSPYHMLAVAALKVVGEQRFSQPEFLDIVETHYSIFAGPDYSQRGPLDPEGVKHAIIDAHNEYYGDNAVTLEELFETAQLNRPPEPTSIPYVAPLTTSSAQPALDQLTTLEELEPLLKQANIRLSEPEDEARTRTYFTGPDSAYHMLAVASLKVIGGRRFKQYINLDIVDNWYSQAAGSDYADHGPLDLEIVKQSLIETYNEYWGNNATSLDELLEPLP
jgi:TIR domain